VAGSDRSPGVVPNERFAEAGWNVGTSAHSDFTGVALAYGWVPERYSNFSPLVNTFGHYLEEKRL
jgi:hypothetical protein